MNIKTLLILIASMILLYFASPFTVEEEKEELLTIEIRGAVEEEKRISIQRGSCLEDVLQEVSLKENADISSFSLNEILYDGEVIVIPEKREEKKISINAATKEELVTLPGIGETMAERILEYRRREGSFHSTEELMLVSGIGEKKYEKLKDFITL